MLYDDIIYLRSKNVKLNNTLFSDIYLCIKIIKENKEMINTNSG